MKRIDLIILFGTYGMFALVLGMFYLFVLGRFPNSFESMNFFVGAVAGAFAFHLFTKRLEREEENK